ncbi:MAG: nucleoside triphosphate pyrophosphohydrolase [Patescibacteria group bacterium]|nr:nucleoside triphosphate pyrophosphohydrolase [Patescibacteria group bacterium]MCL5224440.1 nucleoside triphosphate pyrophosphohydrolase [Patescibacteria group bacterium]
MKKIYYNKLIRDKIPEKIVKHGGQYEIARLKQKDFEKELLKKVGEEASGLLNAKTKKDITSELADIIDVIEKIKRVNHISEEGIKTARREAYAVKGGFRKKLFLVWSSDTGYKTNERRYPRRKRS